MNIRATNVSLDNFYTLDPHDAEIMENSNDEQREAMKRYIDGVMQEFLTERQRQVFKMYYGDGLNSNEIAVKLGIKAQVVRRIASAAMAKVQRHKKIFLKAHP